MREYSIVNRWHVKHLDKPIEVLLAREYAEISNGFRDPSSLTVSQDNKQPLEPTYICHTQEKGVMETVVEHMQRSVESMSEKGYFFVGGAVGFLEGIVVCSLSLALASLPPRLLVRLKHDACVVTLAEASRERDEQTPLS
jgi:hypothetical protein